MILEALQGLGVALLFVGVFAVVLVTLGALWDWFRNRHQCAHRWRLVAVSREDGMLGQPVTRVTYQCRRDPTHWKQALLAGTPPIPGWSTTDVPESIRRAFEEDQDA